MSSSDSGEDSYSPPRKKTKPSASEEETCFYKLADSITSEKDLKLIKEQLASIPEQLDCLFVSDEKLREKNYDEEREVEVDCSSNMVIDKMTMLCLACVKGHAELVSLLISEGVTIDLGTTTPLYVSCKRGDLEIVKLLLESGKNFDLSKGKIIEEVGEEFADFEGCYSGKTPLYVACKNGHVEIVKLLLKDKSIEVNLGYVTPLYAACKNGHDEIVKLLLERSEIKVNKGKHTYSSYWDGFGYTKVDNEKPITISEKNNFESIVSLLKQVKNTNEDEDENDEEEENGDE